MRSDPRGLQDLLDRLVLLGRKVPRVSKGLLGRKVPLAQEARSVLLALRALSARKVPKVKPVPKAPRDPQASAATLGRKVRRDRPGPPAQPARKASRALHLAFASSPERKQLPATRPNNWSHSYARVALRRASSVLLVRPPQVCVFAGNLKQWMLKGWA